jgi:hypothetical protein
MKHDHDSHDLDDNSPAAVAEVDIKNAYRGTVHKDKAEALAYEKDRHH